MARKSAATREAPPIRPPSISGTSDLCANRGVNFLCLGRSRRATGTNRPHRLVSHHSAGKGSHTYALQNSVDLGRNDINGLTGFALSQRLANAQNRTQTGGQRSGKLLGN